MRPAADGAAAGSARSVHTGRRQVPQHERQARSRIREPGAPRRESLYPATRLRTQQLELGRLEQAQGGLGIR